VPEHFPLGNNQDFEVNQIELIIDWLVEIMILVHWLNEHDFKFEFIDWYKNQKIFMSLASNNNVSPKKNGKGFQPLQGTSQNSL